MPRKRDNQPTSPRSTGDDAEMPLAVVPTLLSWYRAHARSLPWRQTSDPYAIWVSEIMLQQTQVKTVIPYWERWMRELPTLQRLANASSEKIHKLWEGLGYYTRVRNMQKAAQQIIIHHTGNFPRRYEDVLNLSGIGRYTAGAICSIAFNQPAPLLDGNVIRVLTRLYGIIENTREKTTSEHLWQICDELIRAADACPAPAFQQTPRCSHFNQSLMELGALICTPRQPKCETCPLKKICFARIHDRTNDLPNLGERAAVTERHFLAFIIQQDGRFLVRQRPEGVVNAHLWEFPNVEVIKTSSPSKTVTGFKNISPVPLKTIRHSITRYRIRLDVHEAKLNAKGKVEGTWLNRTALEQLAFPSAHRKILALLS